jgi:hypothetical protein
MTVPISNCSLLDLDAAVLPAYEVSIDGQTKWIIGPNGICLGPSSIFGERLWFWYRPIAE